MLSFNRYILNVWPVPPHKHKGRENTSCGAHGLTGRREEYQLSWDSMGLGGNTSILRAQRRVPAPDSLRGGAGRWHQRSGSQGRDPKAEVGCWDDENRRNLARYKVLSQLDTFRDYKSFCIIRVKRQVCVCTHSHTHVRVREASPGKHRASSEWPCAQGMPKRVSEGVQ